MTRSVRHTILAAALAVGGFTGVASAASIMNFVQLPTNGGVPEFRFDNDRGGSAPSFYEGAGALGNGDGNLDPGSQSSGGLRATWASSLGLLPTDGAGLGQSATNPNVFYDVTFHFTGMDAAGPATLSSVGSFNVLTQALGAGTFAIYSTAAAATNAAGAALGTQVLLLSGTIGSATISGINGSTTGSTISATLTYDNGLAAILNAIGGAGTKGGFSFTDLNINPSLSSSGGFMNEFTANGTGSFSVATNTGPGPSVPLPAAAWGGMTLLGVLGGVQALRRRSMRQA